MKYIYFVSYKGIKDKHNISGRAEVIRESPITGMEDILEIEDAMKSIDDFECIMVTNYILMRKEEE